MAIQKVIDRAAINASRYPREGLTGMGPDRSEKGFLICVSCGRDNRTLHYGVCRTCMGGQFLSDGKFLSDH